MRESSITAGGRVLVDPDNHKRIIVDVALLS